LVLVIAFMLSANDHAAVTLGAARFGALDVAGVAKFYQSAFGMQEINRLEFSGMKEIMLNFGETVEAAKANPTPWIAIIGRSSNDIKDTATHLVLYMTDMKTTAAAAEAAGGTMGGEPRAFGDAGMIVGFAVDPAGDRMELIQHKVK
jgi:predicted enzyme related to lactoylglutathione lyase